MVTNLDGAPICNNYGLYGQILCMILQHTEDSIPVDMNLAWEQVQMALQLQLFLLLHRCHHQYHQQNQLLPFVLEESLILHQDCHLKRL